MKLTWRIVTRISLLISLVLAGWAVLVYNAVIDEVYDEVDDSLEFMSDNLIERFLRGERLPEADNGTNNTYFLEPVSAKFAAAHSHVEYSDEEVYIESLKENEPARVLRTIFRDRDGDYHRLTVAMPTVETEDLREAIILWIAGLYVVLQAIVVAICVWVLWRSMRPLYGLLGWLDRSDISHGVAPLDNPTNVSEFIRLNEAVVRSARRSEQLYVQQKQFTGNASHELQTPLAVCRTRLDVLLDSPLTESQLGEVVKTQNTLEYMSRLVKELLLLTKIDSGQFSDTDEVDLAVLARRSVEDCDMIYACRGISSRVAGEGAAVARMNPSLAAMLVANLVKNAYVHNCDGGEVGIDVGCGVLAVSNSGESGALDGERIFERFYQGRKREGSTGLGLSLVKAVCDLYGFRLAYSYASGRHVFSVKFG